jgi:hypothetical protein
MKFTHPLARGSRLATVESFDGRSQEVLVIVTTLQLDPSHKKFRIDKVDKLRWAAREYLQKHLPGVRDFLLLNPIKV